MPYKLGKSTKKGYPILKKVGSKWKIVGHSSSKKKAQASIRARYASENSGSW